MEHFRKAEFYRQQAAFCRKQATAGVTPARVQQHWQALAEQYEALARQAMALSAIKSEQSDGY